MIYIPTLAEVFGLNRKLHEHGKWQPKWIISRYKDERDYLAHNPYDVSVVDGNLLTTNGVNLLWTLLNGGGGTTFTTTSSQIGVGDSSTAAAAAQTDLQAAQGSTITTSGLSAATNASPIVITNGSGNWTSTPTVGSVVVVAGVNGNTAANDTWEVSASTATTISLLNSTGNGVFTSSAGATVKAVNKYRQVVNGAPVITTNQISFTSAVGANNGNHVWQEFGTFNNGAATNKQTVAGTMLNRLVSNQGTKAQGATWTVTLQISIT